MQRAPCSFSVVSGRWSWNSSQSRTRRSEEHTSELQSLAYLVCRLLLDKKKSPRPRARHPTVETLRRVAVCRARARRASQHTGAPRAYDRRTGARAFFVNDPATTEIYTLPLHDALPI